MEATAHVVVMFQMEETPFVGQIGIAFGVGEDGVEAGHHQLENGIFNVHTFEEVGHFNKNGFGRQGRLGARRSEGDGGRKRIVVKEEVLGARVFKVLNDHVLGRQGELQVDVRGHIGQEGVVQAAEALGRVVFVDFRVVVGGEHHVPVAHGLHLPQGLVRFLRGLKPIIHPRQDVTVQVCRQP